ncbi:MAG: hypothetical protein LBC79_03890 [Deltaproteobacteria bacterium]|nr:hypothetical protein [Deltaproteobacteria bacterium]
MVRSLAVLLLLCLGVQPVFASAVNWPERVQRFSRYVGRHAIAQDRRTQVLGGQSQSFNRRVQGYVRALEARARPFQAKPAVDAMRN